MSVAFFPKIHYHSRLKYLPFCLQTAMRESKKKKILEVLEYSLYILLVLFFAYLFLHPFG
jgi:hypothetical protein